jgi:NarL family two-component system response regulator LiaR
MMRPIPIILVEDEPLFRGLLQSALDQIPDLRVVGSFSTGTEALASEDPFAVAVMDIELTTGPNGIQTGLLLRRQFPRVGIVILSHHDPATWLPLIPIADRPGWAYLKKAEVRDARAIVSAVRAVALGQDLLGQTTPAPTVPGLVGELTKRQLEILRLIAYGYSNLEISHQLRLAPKSVEHAVQRVYRALEIATDTNWLHPRVEAARRYWSAVASTDPDVPGPDCRND